MKVSLESEKVTSEDTDMDKQLLRFRQKSRIARPYGTCNVWRELVDTK